MAIKVDGQTVIHNSMKGSFHSTNVGSFSEAERNSLTPADGDVIYNSTIKALQYWNGTEWRNTGDDDLIGLPTPLGQEQSILWIKDGQPAWSDPQDPQGPDLPFTVAIYGTTLDQNSTPAVAVSEGGTNMPWVEGDLDTHLRSLPCFTDPYTFDRTGVGYNGANNVCFQLDFSGAAGKVFEVVVTDYTGAMSQSTQYDWSFYLNAQTGSQYIEPIVDTFTKRFNFDGNHQYGTETFSFICLTDDFTLVISPYMSGGFGNGGISTEGTFIHSYSWSDPARFLISKYAEEQQAEQAAKIAAAQAIEDQIVY